jgi:superoxide dismutase, Cu-Zn family
MTRIKTGLLTVAVAATCGAAGVASAADDPDGKGDRDHARGHGGEHAHHGNTRAARAVLRDATGTKVGRVWLREHRRSGTVAVLLTARNLEPGFHGFHIHTTGRCDAPAFTTAGGHLNPGGATHGNHAGDLPNLLVNDDGTGMLATLTDRFSLDDLRDADGSAVMIHSGRDNYANIPPRYGTPDQETLDTGDAGARVACGVVR